MRVNHKKKKEKKKGKGYVSHSCHGSIVPSYPGRPPSRGQKTSAQQISFYKIKIYLDELIFAVMMMMNHETRSLNIQDVNVW